MRKRIMVAALLIVVVAAVTSVLTRPKKDSVEWYRDRCLQLHAELGGETLRWKVSGWCSRLTGLQLIKSPDDDEDRELNREFDRSRKKLLELGFMVRLEYMFTNFTMPRVAEQAAQAQIDKLLKEIARDQQVFTWIEDVEEREIPAGRFIATFWVITPRDDVARWERALGKPRRKSHDVNQPVTWLMPEYEHLNLR